MSTSRSARARKYRRGLTEVAIERILSRTLPKRHGYRRPNTGELLQELRDFSVSTELQLRLLLLKHRRTLIDDARACLRSRPLLTAWSEDHGDAFVRDMLRRQYCFTWEGLTRNALELEFGDAYEEYARKRDGL